MQEKGYTTIPDWMLSLDLDIYEVIILAVIYGFSQDGESSFTGSQNYLARKAKCTRRKVTMALPKLVEMGYVKKDDVSIQGIKLCRYKVCIPFPGCECHSQGGCESHSHNKLYIENIDIRERDNKGRSRFQKPTLEEVTEYCRTRNNGIDPEEFFAFYESKGWMVGKNPMKDWKAAVITWEKSAKKKSSSQRQYQPRRRETTFEHNLRAIDQLTGSNLHEQYYGRRDIDEQ